MATTGDARAPAAIDFPLREGSLRVEPMPGHEGSGLVGVERAASS
ncbi:MAG TPA: hypothetical protein VJL07_04150 [Dehalococcoidia bacterium]|nr:hypothetical protein [Dehalococcoidia bacterium]